MYPTQGLSTAQAAILEERIRQMELEDMPRMMEHETQADLECKMLDDRAKKAQRLQDEALKAREALNRQLEREQHLTKAKQEFEIAKLRSSMLSRGSTHAHSSTHSERSVPFLDLPPPVLARQPDMLSTVSQPSLSTQFIPLSAPAEDPRIPGPQGMQQFIAVSTVSPTGPQPIQLPAATPSISALLANLVAQPQGPEPVAPARLQRGQVLPHPPAVQPVLHPEMCVITSTPLDPPAPQVASSFVSQLPSGPTPRTSAVFKQPSQVAVPLSMYKPTYSYSQPAMKQPNTAPHASQEAPPFFPTHQGLPTSPVLSIPYPGYAPLPGGELLFASALGLP